MRYALTLILLFIAPEVWAQSADICAPGYAREHRMPEAESRAIKRAMLAPGMRAADFELDHRIPLCLGGTNDSSNLQLQPWPEARRKDADEWRLCRAVCAGWMPLAEAQRQMREWRP